MKESENIDKALDVLVDQVFARCESWLDEDSEGNLVLVDPHEGTAIGHHYSLSHFAAAAILGSHLSAARFEEGLAVLRGVLARWGSDSANPSFHNDFNHFALVLAHDELERLGVCEEERRGIERIVLSTPDSNHDTVNWLPMRLLACHARTRWGSDCERAAARIREKIERAVNADGLIEDRLPRGTSFNLQYDASSVALLDLVDALGLDQPVDLWKSYAALAECVLPDGDINYLGRGCNQVFAWGPWLYLLKRRGTGAEWESGRSFLADRLPLMLENENILLNDLPGSARQMWWDYHYCSVYTAHLLMWLVLARRADRLAGEDERRNSPVLGETGVSVSRLSRSVVVSFSGRREYLAEKGPALCAIWTSKHGTVHKGSFGPWGGMFGGTHATPSTTLNHLGLLKASRLSALSVVPLLSEAEVGESDGCLQVAFKAPSRADCCFNLPMAKSVPLEDVSVLADGSRVSLKVAGEIATQYGFELLCQTPPRRASQWVLRIKL